MQISTDRYGMQIPIKARSALGDVAMIDAQSEAARSASGSSAAPVPDRKNPASAFQASLSAMALDRADAATQQTSGQTINPADYLIASDIKLYEKTTGGTIKDGVLYDKDGNVNASQANMDLVCAMYEMRAHGTFSSRDQSRTLLSGDITAADLRSFIEHYSKNPGAYDMDILDRALGEVGA
ncbi:MULTISPECIES: hypothetical protein [unclassified Rhizobium]|jgi:hypothetical protein|uniref:hypothetical protein n=1 Tax=unclassified Rhizobium TaxID=2613769 RepID=UPI000645860D|nr:MULTISPECIES: hypothetical protein [unclassified Rhizobium]MBN8952512.1 hypothetical protein [Rhizobium tropici]OJY78986.1 MAG: hypothetical protein BGP09_24105 [Rhizobium sp. 60-20]RKD67713.1 hypothetical protein BJ928_105114 [Rhizobium sp. WW_1]